nr:hypothetical protein [uncultured Desulfobacter sp.]
MTDYPCHTIPQPNHEKILIQIYEDEIRYAQVLDAILRNDMDNPICYEK